MNKILISESEKIKIRKMYGLIEEGETITPESTCYACKQLADNEYSLDNTGAWGVQYFLITAGYDIPYDGDFGNITATAFATWLYGYKEGIRTPRQLAERMKKDGWNVGKITDTPYGPQMTKEVAKLITQICNAKSVTCKKELNDFSKASEPRINFNKQRNNFHPDKIPSLKKSKQLCETELPKLIPKVKQEFVNWINNHKTQQKITNFFVERLIKDVINGINKNIYSCAGPYDYKEFFMEEASGFYDPTTNKIKVNYEDFETDELFSILIHETTHYIEGNLYGIEAINDASDVQKVYPLSQKNQWKTDLFDNQSFSEKSLKDVPAVSMQQLQSIGVSKDNVGLLIIYWNLQIYQGKAKYACSRQEKEANLKSLRIKYTGSLAGELTKENLRDIMLEEILNIGGSDERFFILCWAGNGFNPPPFEFLKYSNALAVNDNNQDENTNNNNTANLDFSDIDPIT